MTTEITGPTWRGRPVTHEEYAILDARNTRRTPPTEADLAHARHLDAGCHQCNDAMTGADHDRQERDRIESERVRYVTGLHQLTGLLDNWAEADKHPDLLAAPTPAERLVILDRALRKLRR